LQLCGAGACAEGTAAASNSRITWTADHLPPRAEELHRVYPPLAMTPAGFFQKSHILFGYCLCEVVHTGLFIISTWELICEPMKIERCMNNSHPLTTNVLATASSRFV
jgi:hypothetical protein